MSNKNMLGRGLLILFMFWLGAVLPASAGTLFLSGDGNIGNALDGSSGAPITVGNKTWFSNILGSGTTVKVQVETLDSTVVASANAINTYYAGLGGVTSTAFSGTITSAALSGVDLFISIWPSNSYTAGEVSDLSTFLIGGGSLFLLGDAHAFVAENTRINAALAGLGSGMTLGAVSLDGGFHTTTNIDADPFNTGVSSFTYAFSTTIATGGTSLLRTVDTSGAVTFVAYETVVPEPTAFLLMSSAGCIGLLFRRRKRA